MILFAFITGFELQCTKPYNPAVVAGNNNYLVVEGNINTGTDSTTILLSRTTNLSSGIISLPELNAIVAIQDNQNGSYNLTAKGSGVYTSALLTLDPTRMYRLSITTSDGKTFLSDFVPAKVSPPIDSIGFTIQSTGIQIYVNTHDPKNATRYYRWDYTETWEFHAEYSSEYIATDTSIVSRQVPQQVYQCWTNDISTDIQLASSAKLAQDVIYQNPLYTVSSSSEKLEERYSVLLKQYAMTTDGYNYYNLLKQNTQQLGSIFDAQPSTLTSNIHCTTDVTLPVIGYITAGTVAQKRIYINNSQLPDTWRTPYPYNCQFDTAYFNDPRVKPPGNPNTVKEFLINKPNNNTPTIAIIQQKEIIGYQYTDRECADCSIRGSNTPPSFWIAGAYGQ